MITTLTLNPAIDQTVTCSPFAPGSVNRGQSIRLEAGGKGVNVATFLALSGCSVAAAGFLGSENASIFEDWFRRCGINDHFVRIDGQTRLGIKIVDLVGQQTTDINLPGLPPGAAAVDQLLAGLPALAGASDWFVLTGSLPPGLPVDFYGRLVELLRTCGCRVLLDTSGPALRAGWEAAPAVLKPNLAELEELLACRMDARDLPAVAGAVRGVWRAGMELVVVSMGKGGALFVQPGRLLHAVPPAVTARSTVGAGDALVAGLLNGMQAGLDLPACARRAVAFSVAAVTAERRWLPPWDELRRLEALVQLVELPG